MTALLELREKIKLFYGKNEVFISPVVKFLFTFIVLSVLNGRIGYMTRIDNVAIVLIVALMSSFLPKGCIILFSALFSLLHMYALSLEVALVGLFVYLLMFLLFFRFAPKDSLVVVLTTLLCALKFPYVMPIAMGLLGTPASAVSVGCGVVIYYMLYAMAGNASAINNMSSAEDATAKLKLMIDALMNNKAMLVMVVAFAITVIVVYLIRRMSIDYSWSIAMVAGAMINLIILLVGDLIYETNISVMGALFGNFLALAVAKIIEFFRFCVDYSRTEKVQFEDDEYYYYVKAVPKMMVAATTKTVKRINTPRQVEGPTGRGSRSVTTERTTSRAAAGRVGAQRKAPLSSGQSVTIGGSADEQTGDYEELF